MDIVVDTSAIMAVLLDEPERPRIIEATSGAMLCVPASVPWEIGNAVSALVKRRRLDVVQARRVISAFEAIPLETVPIDVSRAVETALEHGLYAYDAYVLEAARVRRAQFLTLDGPLSRIALRLRLGIVEVKR